MEHQDSLARAAASPTKQNTRNAKQEELEANLCRRYQALIMGILITRGCSKPDAEDLCQDVLLQLIEKLRAKKLVDINRLDNYVRQTTKFMLADQHRKAIRRANIFNQKNLGLEEHACCLGLETQHQNQLRKFVDQQMKQLTVERDRAILHTTFLLDLDKSWICQQLSLSSTNYDKVLHRAKQRAKNLITDQALTLLET